jgi:glycosyltransferase involved in cell wall biosynthesis
MRYPNTIFLRYKKYSYIDNYIIEFQNEYYFSIGITHDKKYLNNMFSSNYHLLITFGDNKEEYRNDIFSILPDRFEKYWLHFNDFSNIEELNKKINDAYIGNVLTREFYRPVFSIFTTCYNSYHKIIRAYNSLQNQIYLDWEWVIIDDSPDDEHFYFLREHFLKDKRVRFFKKSENNGNIGNLKNEAVSLCRGKYVVELDHDDAIVHDLLRNAIDIFENDTDIGFIYSDFINIYENGDNFKYEGAICKGYGSYYKQKYNNKWVDVYITPNINNITLSLLLCCPNHVRIWKKEVLINIGNYSEQLYICDDYEILLKTAINTKIAKLHKLGYIQYMNDNNNNFSMIRNSEINRIGPEYISPIFYKTYDIHSIMKSKNAYEDIEFMDNHSNIWERNHGYNHIYCNSVINPDYDKQYCIIGIETLLININYYKELYKNPRNDFVLLDNKLDIEKLIEKIDDSNFDRMKCYSLLNNSREEMIQYFYFLYKSTNNIEILYDSNNIFHFPKRSMCINRNILDKSFYLEIGIEYGNTFLDINTKNKIGVDPDSKYMDCCIIQKTSDDFFKTNIQKFDVIFIDGMHQVEYVINDINNSILVLNTGGKILIDDILPFTYNEQLKIPNDHIYENGILKYRESWTGDIWKVIYHILLFYKDCIDFNIYFNSNYRGVFEMSIKSNFEISHEKIKEINSYEYNNDFRKYIKILQEREVLLEYWI